MLKSYATCLLILLLAVTLRAETWQLTILHANDRHGVVLPFKYTGQKAYAREDVGGIARAATVIARLRKSIKHPLVVVDCGDAFTRVPLLHAPGKQVVDAMNLMGVDLFCVGNEEFKATFGADSQGIMLALLQRSRFPWLAANLTVGNTGQPVAGIHPYVVKTYGHVRVGFLGLTAPRAKDYRQTRGWTISDPIETARQWVPIVRKECDILIAVTHLGINLDQQLAAQVPGIAAIIGGDSHTFLAKPLLVKSPNGAIVPIVQAGEYGVVLGRCDLTFEHTDAWRLVKSAEQLIPIDKTIPDDSAVKALLDR